MTTEKLFTSDGLIGLHELKRWLSAFGYPTQVRVFVDGTHMRKSPFLESEDDIPKLYDFPFGAEFYAVRVKRGDFPEQNQKGSSQ